MPAVIEARYPTDNLGPLFAQALRHNAERLTFSLAANGHMIPTTISVTGLGRFLADFYFPNGLDEIGRHEERLGALERRAEAEERR